jgi:hypothetical protein
MELAGFHCCSWTVILLSGESVLQTDFAGWLGGWRLCECVSLCVCLWVKETQRKRDEVEINQTLRKRNKNGGGGRPERNYLSLLKK